ncbi:hypothetical protein MKEN_01484700 [Mycena kentingensis (nom. inval.)]|nr:hypothetical protein MKEN_01484700 [Mycena kentingensis (nom. inval.)]
MPPQDAHHPTLLSLPNELLVAIFQSPIFPSDALCKLATLSRRLHGLALPIYFSRSGLPEPSKSVSVRLRSDGADMLAALDMALFLTEIGDITAVFPHPSCQSVLPLLPHVDRLSKFVSKFPSVKRATLELDAYTSLCNTTGDDSALRAWSTAFGRLLNALVERRCTELTVRYGGYLTRTFTLSTTTSAKQAMWAMQRTFGYVPSLSGKDWEFRRVASQGRESTFVSAAPRSATLTTLHIHSAVLVTLPCLNWTLSALRQGAITSLTLAKIALDHWGPVLELIARAAPRLAFVSLRELEGISQSDIFTFLGRLPRLASLDIWDVRARRAPAPVHWKWTKAHAPKLPALTSLLAPPDFLLPALRTSNLPFQLNSLCINLHNTSNYNYNRLQIVSRELGTICQLLASRLTRSPRLRICLALVLSTERIMLDLDALPLLSGDAAEYFSHVSSLTLDVFPHSSVDVARWVREVCPSAEEVVLSIRTHTTTENSKSAANIKEAFAKAFSTDTMVKKLSVDGFQFQLGGRRDGGDGNVTGTLY